MHPHMIIMMMIIIIFSHDFRNNRENWWKNV